jgi:hypothetical protein
MLVSANLHSRLFLKVHLSAESKFGFVFGRDTADIRWVVKQTTMQFPRADCLISKHSSFVNKLGSFYKRQSDAPDPDSKNGNVLKFSHSFTLIYSVFKNNQLNS